MRASHSSNSSLYGASLKAWYFAPLGAQTSRVRVAGIAGEDAVEPLLELPDLLGVPAVRRVQQPGRHIAFGEMLQLHHLAPQRDVDRHHDLLDRTEAIGLVRARVARQVEQLVAGQQPPRPAVNHLLVGRRRRLRPAPGVVDQHLDRGAVDDIETDDFAAAVAAQLERRRIEHQHDPRAARAASSRTAARRRAGARIRSAWRCAPVRRRRAASRRAILIVQSSFSIWSLRVSIARRVMSWLSASARSSPNPIGS